MNVPSRHRKRNLSEILKQTTKWVSSKRPRRFTLTDPTREKKRIEEDLEHLLEDIDGSVMGKGASVYSKDNHIYFQSDVSKASVTDLIDLLEEKNEEYAELKKCKLVKNLEPNPIYLHITSFGGDLFMGFSAVDAIQKSEVPVHTIVEGYAASCGSLMAIAGEKRYMTPRSFQLMHQLSSGVIGKFAEIEDEFNNCEGLMDSIIDLYVKKTSMTKKEIIKQLKHDSWWDSKKCLKSKLTDEIWQ
jgi:ATP-dependent protease ClpP protease subunit